MDDVKENDDALIVVEPIHYEEALVPAHLLKGMGPLGVTPEEQCLILQYVSCLQTGPKPGWRSVEGLAQRLGVPVTRVHQLITGLKSKGFWNGAEGTDAIDPLSDKIFDLFGATEDEGEDGNEEA